MEHDALRVELAIAPTEAGGISPAISSRQLAIGELRCSNLFMKLTVKRKINMGLTRIDVTLKSRGSSKRTYRDQFLVDTGATDSMAPASKLRAIGIKPVGERAYELADGTRQNYQFGLADIAFLNEITAGRVIFGPDNVEPILGITALESAGITVDPANQTLHWLPAIPLK